MKLLYTPNSPYARIARVCALENAVVAEPLQVAIRDAADVILGFTPTGKVPALVLEDERVLSDSHLICEYFDSIGRGGFTAHVADIEGRCLEGLVSGFLDGIAVCVRETRRTQSEQSPGLLQLEHERLRRCVEYFERHWDVDSARLNFASVALASALELVDMRLQTGWRSMCPKLCCWFDEISKSPSLRATAPLRQ